MQANECAFFDSVVFNSLMQIKFMDAAKRSIKAIRTGLNVLELQSAIGRPIDDMPEEYRDWIIDFGDSGYLVRYRIDSELVIILAVRR